MCVLIITKRSTDINNYRQIEDGEEIHPDPKGFKFACCDCGLVHTLKFKTRPLRMRTTRDTVETNRLRLIGQYNQERVTLL